MKRTDLITWIIGKGYRDNGRNSNRYIKAVNNKRTCFKLTSIGIRYEVEAIHEAGFYSPASKSWVRIRSGYISKVSVNQDNKLTGLTKY